MPPTPTPGPRRRVAGIRRPRPDVPTRNATRTPDENKVSRPVRNRWRHAPQWAVPAVILLGTYGLLDTVAESLVYQDAYIGAGCEQNEEGTRTFSASELDACINAGRAATEDLHFVWVLLAIPVAIYAWFLFRSRISSYRRRVNWNRVRVFYKWNALPEAERTKIVDDHEKEERRRAADHDRKPLKERRRRVPMLVHIIGITAICFWVLSLFLVWWIVLIIIVTILVAVVLWRRFRR